MKVAVNVFNNNSVNYTLEIKNIINKGLVHGLEIYKEWIRKGAIPFRHPSFKNCPRLLKQIVETTDFDLPPIARTLDHEGLKKFWLEVEGGLIESVIIPMNFGYSLCVSSQVGCKMGCTFCQTGKMGLIRNLRADEIVKQLFIAKTVFGYAIRNIVFMGMGEPFDNFDEVKKAISIMTDENGFGIGPRHITVSTSGRIDGIMRMKNELPSQINLAVSINAPTEAIRTRIMPVNRKFSMQALKEALIDFCRNSDRVIFAEYVLLAGLNDSLIQADELAEYLSDIPV
ncbi:MAG: radical SAM protein, partial [Parachlamydiaceae bacterium]